MTGRSKKNILIFEPYPFNSEGGNQKTLSYFLRFTDRNKFNLIVVTPFKTNYVEKLQKEHFECLVVEAPNRVNRYGGEIVRLSLWGKLLTALAMFRYNLKLSKIIKAKKIDLIYCNSIRTVLTVAIAARLSLRPILWYIKGELGNPFLDFLGFIVAMRILFFCESNRDDKYPFLIRMFKKKIGILRIGLDIGEIQNIRQKNKQNLIQELGINSQLINLVFVGQIYPTKGVIFLIEAVGKIAPKFPGIMLYLIGDHVIEEYKFYKDDIMQLVHSRGLDGKVVFTGWRPDALEIVSLMDILIHPSLSEGFGRAVLEGMAFGKPVIATRVGGLRELIRDGENGFLVNPKDVDALTNRIEILIESKDLREQMGNAAEKTVFEGYRIEEKIKDFEKILIEMLDVKR